MSENDDKPEGREPRVVPIVEEDFASLLTNFKIKPDQAKSIAENISFTGGAAVFEVPALLTKRLTAWSGEITPGKRKLIIEQWFAEKGIDVPPEVIKQAGQTLDELKRGEGLGGEPRYRFDPESGQIVMAKPEEGGGTLAQARQLKKMAEESTGGGRELPFIPTADGKLALNPKAKLSVVELIAYDSIKRGQEGGTPVDPIQAMADAAGKLRTLKTELGISGEGTADWSKDPVKFIETIRKITGEGEASPALLEKMNNLEKTIETMREERHQEELSAQRLQISNLAQKVEDLTNAMNDPTRRPGAKTDMDLISEIVSGVRTEVAAARTDIKGLIQGHILPAGKSEENRAQRKDKYRQQLEDDKEIESIGNRLFFTQS